TYIVVEGYHRCMAMKQELAVDDHATQAYAHLFQAFADPTRLALLQHLSTGEHRVRALVEHMNLAQSTVTKHLSFLLEFGLITPRPQGTATCYALAAPALLKILAAAADKMLDATGKSAQRCVHLRLDEAQLEEK